MGVRGAVAHFSSKGGQRPSTLQFIHYATTLLVSQPDGWNEKFVVSTPPHFYLASYRSAPVYILACVLLTVSKIFSYYCI